MRAKVRIPKGLNVIKEVIDDSRYKNKSLVKSLKLDRIIYINCVDQL